MASSRLNVCEYNFTVGTAEEAIRAVQAGQTGQLENAGALAQMDAAKITADSMAGYLPVARSLPIPPWGIESRTDVESRKIAVTADECIATVREVFPLAHAALPKITQLADTVFLLQP